MSEHTKLLSCWHKLEHFNPSTLPTGNKIIEQKTTIQEPWYGQEVNFEEKTTAIYTLYFGAISSNVVSDFVSSFFEAKEKDENKEKEHICYASIKLDASGRYIKDTFGLSSLPWALGQLENEKIASDEWEKTFSEKRDEIFESLESVLYEIIEEEDIEDEYNGGERKLIRSVLLNEDLYSIDGIVKESVGWSVIPTSKVFIQKESAPILKDQKQKREIKSSCSILNSFYTKDLEKIINSKNTAHPSSAFTSYLRGNLNDLNERKDLKEDLDALKDKLRPSQYPDGCWPSEYSLNLMQQFAVNRIVENARQKSSTDTDKLFSVNGPPGTGKTTLLRHAIAGILVERAKRLATYKKPEDAFIEEESITNESNFKHKIRRPKDDLNIGGIVIASSNNGAVQNITEELPLKTEVGLYADEIEYFKQTAHDVSNEKNWGVISAVLGSKKNTNNFIKKHWILWEEGKANIVGLQSFLKSNTITATKPWKTIVEEFDAKLAEVTQEKDRLEEVRKRSSIHQELLDEVELSIQELQAIDEELLKLESAQLKAKNKFSILEEKLEKYWTRIALVQSTKPSFFEYWLSSNSRNAYKNNLANVFEEQRQSKVDLEVLREMIQTIELDLKAKNERKVTIAEEQAKCNRENELVQQAKIELGANYADAAFWGNTESKEVQNSCPWYSTKLQELQSELFILSLKLQETFLLTANRTDNMIVKSISAWIDLMNKKVQPSSKEVENLWNTFFMVVPVISSTFASVQKMFAKLEAETLPWLFIDEAGQAIPQAAAGAIWRSKNVVVVGDPFQIEPVVTISDVIIDNVRKYFSFNSLQIDSELSVQTVSDRVNTYGMFLCDSKGEDLWIGSPLRVHRRCIDPMFSISNSIAYDNSMFLSTHQPKELPLKFKTEFIHVKGNVENKHFTKEQATVVGNILVEEINAGEKLPDVYVITPFKEISQELRKFLKESIPYQYEGKSPTESKAAFSKWINSRVGTIHTFQGKQADGVILCLGLDDRTRGAATWASQKPNILNVALTRAKYKFIAVGDESIWLNQTYFQQLKNLN